MPRKKVCHACGHAVDSSARRCPHCGARSQRERKTAFQSALGAMGCIVPFVIVLLALAMCSGVATPA
ncbi:MAG: zinc-ribbon domain-containing protein [Longimicrobiaceae bacterium]